MKNLLFVIVLSVSQLFASSNMKDHDHKMNEEMKTSLKENKSFNSVLAAYEKLNQAFFDNKIDEIKKTAKSVGKAIDNLDDMNISKTLKYSRSKLDEISKSDDIKTSQEAFNIVSQGVHVALTKSSGNKKYARYYCPMVKKYWIQNIEETKGKTYNPYASSSMPHCGGAK